MTSSLSNNSLSKSLLPLKETVAEIEALADTITKSKSPGSIKKAIVKGIPRQAVLKPSHVAYRLQNQHFALGDRVTMVQDSGGVPLSVKGVVVGLNAKSMDVVWDVPFMSGVTLGDRSVLNFAHSHLFLLKNLKTTLLPLDVRNIVVQLLNSIRA